MNAQKSRQLELIVIVYVRPHPMIPNSCEARLKCIVQGKSNRPIHYQLVSIIDFLVLKKELAERLTTHSVKGSNATRESGYCTIKCIAFLRVGAALRFRGPSVFTLSYWVTNIGCRHSKARVCLILNSGNRV
jgi:hypothetical protein